MATLVIETGAVVADANSYISDADLTTYAANCGIVLDGDAESRSILILKAMRYIEALLPNNVKGARVSCDQKLSFPRCHVIVDGCTLPQDQIPQLLKDAVSQAVISSQNGVPFWPAPVTETAGMGSIKKKTLGPLTKEYHATNQYSNVSANHLRPIQIAEVMQFLGPLLGSGTGSCTLTTRRA